MTGTDVDGNRVNMTAFVDSDGKGLKLVQGSYELVLAGSPLGHDGTVWATPCTTFGLKLDSSLEKDQEVDASSGEAIKPGNKIDPIDVTDEQLDTAEKLAMQGGCDSETTAKALASAARSSRDAAVSAKQAKDAAEAQKRAEQEAKKAKDEAAHAQRNAASSGAPNGAAPFWGAFAMASKNPETSWNKVEEMQKSGFPDATVVCTTDWGEPEQRDLVLRHRRAVRERGCGGARRRPAQGPRDLGCVRAVLRGAQVASRGLDGLELLAGTAISASGKPWAPVGVC